ncbi:MAG: PD-(D/E)XK nuclease family protein [Armatimonadetes bacterium]|nr:PD-(D/E)XK nuclease family protein [Armatimonadota bacterium]
MLIRPKPKPNKPRKPTLSPTKIGTYLACRLKYKFTYIDKIARFYYRPKSYHSFGASLHRTLEEFHKEGGAETQSPEQLVEKLHTAWTSQGYASREEEQQRLGAAAELLENYHKEYLVEGVQTLFTEKQLKWDMGEFYLIGRLDRADEHPNGLLEIIDYKSGRMSVAEEEIRNDLAMNIYAYLASKCYPDRHVAATIYCLRSGEKATAEFTDEDLAEIEDGVLAIASDILQTDEDSDIEPEWIPNECPNCDFLRLCARRMQWEVAETPDSGMLSSSERTTRLSR